jgi:hypothetical protein
MLNVYELERQWFRYKIRYYLPLGVAAVSIFLVAALGWFYWPDQAVEPVKKTSNTLVQHSTAAPAIPVSSPSASPVPVAEVKPVQAQVTPAVPGAEKPAAADSMAIMQPSLGFIQTMKEEAQPTVEREHVTSEYVPEDLVKVEPETTAAPSRPIRTQQSNPEPITVQAEKPKSHVSITPQDANDLQDVIKRFASNKNPALSLFLARRYYEMGDYQHAYDYALQTNELDNGIEASWLIFAKSLVKLDQKEQAIKVLTSYFNHSKSLRAKGLLEEIQSGQFQ